MFGSLGPLEIGIIALIVILLFGAGKISGLGKDLGSSIKEFRKAVKDEDDPSKQAPMQAQAQPQPPQQLAPPQQQQYTPPPPAQQPPAAQQPTEHQKNIF
ncbi:MAG: twin-arginine translocase TatA/TatE family subunit [Anaerolinea sp.]|nr:twin-arginine translocase TatA/TatE family subunit [Anaerolinea sp.]